MFLLYENYFGFLPGNQVPFERNFNLYMYKFLFSLIRSVNCIVHPLLSSVNLLLQIRLFIQIIAIFFVYYYNFLPVFILFLLIYFFVIVPY